MSDGVQYRLLKRGDGEKIKHGESIGFNYVSRNWGLKKMIDSGGVGMVAGETDWNLTFYDELLPGLYRGDAVEVFVPPEAWNSYMGDRRDAYRLFPTVYEIRIHQ